MERYIGLDVHAESCTAAVIDAHGKRLGKAHVLETNASTLIEFLKSQSGRLHVCLEEGTQSTWLAEALGKHVAEKLTLARRIAAIALAMWKRKEVYDPAKYAKSS